MSRFGSRLLVLASALLLSSGCTDASPETGGGGGSRPAAPADAPAITPEKTIGLNAPPVPAEEGMLFRSEEGGFSIRFPAAPATERTQVPTVVGDITMVTHTARDGHVDYGVMYGDYPEEMMKDYDLQKGLDGARNGAISNIGGTLIEEQAITFAGQPARAFEAATTLQGAKLRLRARLFLVDNRIFQLMVIHPESETGAEADAFFASFELEHRPG
jgi:hypothetical protein